MSNKNFVSKLSGGKVTHCGDGTFKFSIMIYEIDNTDKKSELSHVVNGKYIESMGGTYKFDNIEETHELCEL